MRLVHELTVAAPVDEVLSRLRGAEHSGSLRVRVAGTQITYRGTVRIETTDVDELTTEEYPLTVHIAATEARGDGAATATASLTLTAAGRPKVKTKARAEIDLAVTGRAATADETALGDTTKRLLRDLLAGPKPAGEPAAPPPETERPAEPAAEHIAQPVPEPSPGSVQRPLPVAAAGPPTSGPPRPGRLAAAIAVVVLLLLLLRRLRRS